MSLASRIRDKLKNNNLESSGGHTVSTSGTKVIRYRAGQKPDYAEAEDDQDSHFSNIQNQKSIKEAEINDPRLNRFKNRSAVVSETSSIEERKASRRRHHDSDDDNDKTTTTTTTTTERRIQKTEIIKEDSEHDDDNEDDRRKRAKEKYLKNKIEEEEREKQRELDSQPFKDVEGEEEGSSSEYETDSEEEDEDDDEYWNQQPIIRPTFIKKDERGTIKTDEQWEKEEKEYENQIERENEQRKIEAHRKLKDELERDRIEQEAKELEEKQDKEFEDDDDEDGKKYDAWIEREIERIRQEIRSRLLINFEKEEKERRRLLSDNQILEEDPSRVRNTHSTKKLKFLQADYHRGAFFQDDEYIKNKDFSEPTGEDKFNRELLPKVMQVKNFGKAGRTKYTHLKDQDTSSKDSYWSSSSSGNSSSNKNYRDKR